MSRKKIVSLGVIGSILALSGGISGTTYTLVKKQNENQIKTNQQTQISNELQTIIKTNFETNSFTIKYQSEIPNQKLNEISLNEAKLSNFKLYENTSNGTSVNFEVAYPEYEVIFAFKPDEYFVELGSARLILTIRSKNDQTIKQTFEWQELFTGFKVEQKASQNLNEFADTLIKNPKNQVVYTKNEKEILPSAVSDADFSFGQFTDAGQFVSFSELYQDQTSTITPVFAIDRNESSDVNGLLVVNLQLKVANMNEIYQTETRKFKLSGFKTQADADKELVDSTFKQDIAKVDYRTDKSKIRVAEAINNNPNDNFLLIDQNNNEVALNLITKTIVAEPTSTDGSVKVTVTLTKGQATASRDFIVEGFKTKETADYEILATELNKITAAKVVDELAAKFPNNLPSSFNQQEIVQNLIFVIDNNELSATQYNNNNDFKLVVEPANIEPKDQQGQIAVNFFLRNTNFPNIQSPKTLFLTGLQTQTNHQLEQLVNNAAKQAVEINYEGTKQYEFFTQSNLADFIASKLTFLNGDGQKLTFDSVLNYEVVDLVANEFVDTVTFKVKFIAGDFSATTQKTFKISQLETKQTYAVNSAMRQLAAFKWNAPEQKSAQNFLPSQIVASPELQQRFQPFGVDEQPFVNPDTHLKLNLTNFRADDANGLVFFDVVLSYSNSQAEQTYTATQTRTGVSVAGFAPADLYYNHLLERALNEIKGIKINDSEALPSETVSALQTWDQEHDTILTLDTSTNPTPEGAPAVDIKLSYTFENVDDNAGTLTIIITATINNFAQQKRFALTNLTTTTKRMLTQLIAAVTNENFSFSDRVDRTKAVAYQLESNDLILQKVGALSTIADWENFFDVAYQISSTDPDSGTFVVSVTFTNKQDPTLSATKEITFNNYFRTFSQVAAEELAAITRVTFNRNPSNTKPSQVQPEQLILWTANEAAYSDFSALKDRRAKIKNLTPHDQTGTLTLEVALANDFAGTTELTKTFTLTGFQSATTVALNKLAASLSVEVPNKQNLLANPNQNNNLAQWSVFPTFVWSKANAPYDFAANNINLEITEFWADIFKGS
ncbi:lipoprotein 17-related variable surface protein, partial [Mycoplasmopsis columbinasalis]|uniref:lipoprotein 17-related variable surface protein n=1 Tax=Mycoplasmopsis columbinasalis TaxID=114880 RepID=UPI00101D979A